MKYEPSDQKFVFKLFNFVLDTSALKSEKLRLTPILMRNPWTCLVPSLYFNPVNLELRVLILGFTYVMIE